MKDKGGRQYLLSTTDVFVPASAREGDLVIQPGRGDVKADPQEERVAELARWIPVEIAKANQAGEGAAIAKILPGVDVSPEILGIGPIQGIAGVELGDDVQIAGRTSSRLTGRMIGLSDEIDIPYESKTAVFRNLIIIQPSAGTSSQPGDSGAPVLTMDGKLVGMLFAASPKVILVIPIRPILGRLDVELVQ